MTLSVRTFGCRLNQAEGAQIESAFEATGFKRVKSGVPVDVAIVNTCTVTQKAESECLKFMRHLRASHPDTCIVLTGCAVATADLDGLRGIVDIIIPNAQKDELPAIVMRSLKCKLTSAPTILKPHTQRATIKVQDGCDCFCAYCIVPHARGTPQSRPFDACLAEARAMIDAGFQEIIVTGCNTATYQDTGRNLVDLLKALLALPRLGRLRLSSIEPKTLEHEIAQLMLTEPKLCRYLHLPIQSGSNATLNRMSRRYTIDYARHTLDTIYEMLPDISIGTDLIAGFPGETEEDFAHSCALIEAYPFSKVHVFPYSERPKTAAEKMPDQISPSVRKSRARTLIQLAEKKRKAYLQRFVGKPVTLLIEKIDAKGCAYGWSAEYLPCEVNGLTRDRIRSLYTFTPIEIRDDALNAKTGATDILQ